MLGFYIVHLNDRRGFMHADHFELHQEHTYIKPWQWVAIVGFIVFLIIMIFWGPKDWRSYCNSAFWGIMFLCLIIFMDSGAYYLSKFDKKHNHINTIVGANIEFKERSFFSKKSTEIVYDETKHGSIDLIHQDNVIIVDRYFYKITLPNGKKQRIFAIYTQETGEKIKKLCSVLKNYEYCYPFRFSYYRHGHLLVDICLLESVDYPESIRILFDKAYTHV